MVAVAESYVVVFLELAVVEVAAVLELGLELVWLLMAVDPQQDKLGPAYNLVSCDDLVPILLRHEGSEGFQHQWHESPSILLAY